MIKFIIPCLVLALIIYSIIKKVNVYNAFVEGGKKSLYLVKDIFPFLIAVFIVVELFKVSGLSQLLSQHLGGIFGFLGIPKQLIELTLLRPFTGSGSLAVLNDIYNTYGVDTYLGRSASVIMGSSETVFYVATVYFSKTKIKKLGYALPIALFCSLMGAVLACFVCKFI